MQEAKIDLLFIEQMQHKFSYEKQQQMLQVQEEQLASLQRMIPLERFLQVREVAMMQMNDFQTLQSRQGHLLESIAKQKLEIQELQVKLRQFQSRINPDKLKTQKVTVQKLANHLVDSEFRFYLRQIEEGSP